MKKLDVVSKMHEWMQSFPRFFLEMSKMFEDRGAPGLMRWVLRGRSAGLTYTVTGVGALGREKIRRPDPGAWIQGGWKVQGEAE